MKTRIVLTIFTAIVLLAQMSIFTLLQRGSFVPDAAASFSQFSMLQNFGATVNSRTITLSQLSRRAV